jgi:hypothetical protein
MNQTKQYNIIISFLVIIFLVVIVIIYKQHKPNLEGFRDSCVLTSKTHAQGAKCIGSDYRKTSGWCCSDYGKSKGYKWADPNEKMGS